MPKQAKEHAHFQVMAPVAGTVLEGWRALMGKLGLPSLAAGAKIQSHAGTAPLTGVVEKVGPVGRVSHLEGLRSSGR